MTDQQPHTPTVDELRRMYALKVPHDQRDRRHAEFDRFLAAAEQRGADKSIQRAERLLKEDREELGETVSVQLIIDWLRTLDGIPINYRADQMEDDE